VKRYRALWFRLCLGLTLMLGLLMLVLAIAPVLTMAADPPRIVGTWEGVLDPGAQPKKHIVVHISADQDGSLSGTIDYPDQDVSEDARSVLDANRGLQLFETRLAGGTAHRMARTPFTQTVTEPEVLLTLSSASMLNH
jgi:hypothetical protein